MTKENGYRDTMDVPMSAEVKEAVWLVMHNGFVVITVETWLTTMEEATARGMERGAQMMRDAINEDRAAMGIRPPDDDDPNLTTFPGFLGNDDRPDGEDDYRNMRTRER